MSEEHEHKPEVEETEHEKTELDDTTRNFLTRNYFFLNKPSMPTWRAKYFLISYLTIGSGIFFILYFNKVFFTITVGTLSILTGIFSAYKAMKPYLAEKEKFSNRPTDDQIENWLLRDIKNNIKPKAIEMLSLDKNKIKDDNFIIIPHPIFWQVGGIEDEYITRHMSGEGYYNYTSFKVQVLALTENYVSLYTCTYDWINNVIHSEGTNEFFYDDISSIKNDMEHISHKFINAEEPEEGEEAKEAIDNSIGAARVFRIKNMSGESITLVTDIPSLSSSPRVGQKIDKIIQVLRFTLRNRRYGETFEVVRPEEEEKIDDEKEH